MINIFRKEHAFLSNFYSCPVRYRGIVFPTSEHAYQWAKTDSEIWKERILSRADPRHAKRVGRLAPMRNDWEQVKVRIMGTIVKLKFKQNKELAKKLLGTGNQRLIEGNWWNDTFWGVCNGQGQNHLGKILMAVRKELRKKSKA